MKHIDTNYIRKVAMVAMTIPLLASGAGRDEAIRLNDEGVALVQKGEIKKAIGRFKSAIDADVHYVESAHNLGKLLIAAKQYAHAEKLLTYVTRENPGDMGSYVQLAQATALLGKDNACAAVVDKIAKGDKKLLPSLALLLSGQGSQKAAECAIERAVAEDPGNPEAWYDKGVIEQRAKKVKEAAESYAKAVALRPSYVNALVNLGNMKDELGDVDGAISSYEKAYKADSSSSLAKYNLGRMLVLKGKDPRRGLDLLQSATKHGNEPGANAARRLLEYLVAQTKNGGVK